MPFYSTYIPLCLWSLRTHSPNLARSSPMLASSCFLVSLKSASELRSWRHRWPAVYCCTPSIWGTPKRNFTTGREIRWTCRPRKMAAQWNNVLWENVHNDLHGCPRWMGSAPPSHNLMVGSSIPPRLSSSVRNFRNISTQQADVAVNACQSSCSKK
jgi:hypothetical protein